MWLLHVHGWLFALYETDASIQVLERNPAEYFLHVQAPDTPQQAALRADLLALF